MEARRRLLDTAALAGRRVLIAEDNLINRVVAKKMCAALGINVAVANDGAEAVAAAMAAAEMGPPFDAILMDCSMPTMSGTDATRALRAAGVLTPVIGFTANASTADRDACLLSGMDGFLSKPVLKDRLAEALLLVLTGRAKFQDRDTFAAAPAFVGA